MREFINILESVDEFSMKGHAGQRIKQNAPRFSDNPMQGDPVKLDEFDPGTMGHMAELDRLHDMLSDAGVSDLEISQGVQLTDGGLHKVAAALGIAPERANMLVAALTQQVRDESETATEGDIEESYQRFVEEDDDDDLDPFEPAADGDNDDDDDDHLSAEPDYIGDLTVRSSKTGRSKFFQGSKAADISAKLKGADTAQQQDVLRPLMEIDDDLTDGGFANEIRSDSGSYNFPWKLRDQRGFGTVQYGLVGGKPTMKLISVRDTGGDEVDTTQDMRDALLTQAKRYIPDA